MSQISGRRGRALGIAIQHRGHIIPTSVGSRGYENIYGGSNNEIFVKKSGVIPMGYEHRPELISNLFSDTPSLWWVVCERNNIFDIFEQLKSGDSIRIPL
jgi:hypothetical protein